MKSYIEQSGRKINLPHCVLHGAGCTGKAISLYISSELGSLIPFAIEYGQALKEAKKNPLVLDFEGDV